DEMGRVEVRADDWIHGLAQLEEGLRVIDDKARMHFEADLDAIFFQERHGLLPVGDHDVVPLVIEDFEVIRRPRACHPIGTLVPPRASGAAAEGDYDSDAELIGESHRLAEIAIEGGREPLPGV